MLEWDRNAETNVTGYRAYYGPFGPYSRRYSVSVDVGNHIAVTINRLIPGKTYYFAVTAYTKNGLESDFSNEVSYSVPTTAAGPSCVGCFSNLDDFLAANEVDFSHALAARVAMPTNSPCLDAGLSTLRAIVKTAGRNTNSEFVTLLKSVAQCMAADIEATVSLDRKTTDALLPSRWSTSASNQINRMQAILNHFNTQTNISLQSQSLTRVGKMLTRTATLINSGNLAPLNLSNRIVHFSLTVGHEKISQILQFGETSVTISNVTGAIQTGTYVYQRGAWNEGTLTLSIEGTPDETLTIIFGRRWRVRGLGIRGFALPQ